MKPTEIVDMPIPLLDGSINLSTGTNTTQQSNTMVVVPTTQVDVAFPPVVIAQETISQSLDTQTKRIKGAYSFESLGAISVGEFEQGVSGEVKISPDGVVAKNVNGDTTFALDGTTGDATFAGTVAAGAVISATISADKITAGTLAVNTNIIVNDGTNDRVLLGYQSGGF